MTEALWPRAPFSQMIGGVSEQKRVLGSFWGSPGQKQKIGGAKFSGKVFKNGFVGGQKLILLYQIC